jgi:hypothetical protein
MRDRESPDAVANKPPARVAAGLDATDMTLFSCPTSLSCICPVQGSQKWTARSLEAERTHSESGVIATLRTKS